MDDLNYTYKTNTNQLDKVVDAATDAATGDYDKYNDIKRGQANGNYRYDAIGNLVKDSSEGITNIIWNVYGKISSIKKTDSTTISYSYDASGNRINKKVTKSGTTRTTVYVRDASGNVMSIYAEDPAINSGHLTQTEADMYGSSRLGVWNMSRDVSDLAAIDYSNYSSTFERGNKFFELSNHLGNVLATVDDKKVGVDTNSDGIIDYDTAEVVSAQDFYPFGMLMPSRKYSIANTNYRYGFNGKENDNDIESGAQDYGMRIYDGRLGRFLSIDPLTKSYPWLTPYQFSANSPIRFIDLDGAEIFDPLTKWFTADAAITITTKPKSGKAKVYGTIMGVAGSMEGAVQGAIHPLQSAKALIKMASQSPIQNAVDYGLGMSQKYDGLPEPVQNYAVFGNVTSDVLLTVTAFKRITKPSSALATTLDESTAAAKTIGVSFGDKTVPIYRGGSSFELKPGEYRITPNGKYPARGLSLDANPENAAKFGGAYQIVSIPDELEIIHTPSKNNPAHFDIIPKDTKTTTVDFQKLLNQIVTKPVKEK